MLDEEMNDNAYQFRLEYNKVKDAFEDEFDRAKKQ